MSVVTVFPCLEVKGYAGTDKSQEGVLTYPNVPLLEALLERYTTNAMACPLVVTSDEGEVAYQQPRLNKSAFPDLIKGGMRIKGTTVFLDADSVEAHKTNQPATDAWLYRCLEKLDSDPLLRTAGVYQTKRGFRVLWPLETSLDLEEFQEVIADATEYMGTLFNQEDTRVDLLVDANRLYRLPYVVREGESSESSAGSTGEPFVDISQMQNLDVGTLRTHLAGLRREAPPADASMIFGSLATSGSTTPQTVPETVKEMRNVTLASVAGRLRRQGLEFDEILATLLTVNENRCKPPLPPSDVETIARSISRYEAGTFIPDALIEFVQDTINKTPSNQGKSPPSSSTPSNKNTQPEQAARSPYEGDRPQVADDIGLATRLSTDELRQDIFKGIEGHAPDTGAKHARPGGVKIRTDRTATPVNRQGSALRRLGSAARSLTTFTDHSETMFANYVIANLVARGPAIYCRGTFWQYEANDGCWSELSEHSVRAEILVMDGLTVSTGIDRAGNPINKTLTMSHRLAEGVLAIIQTTLVQPDAYFDDIEPGVAFSNGFLSPDRGLVPHSPTHRCRYSFPWEYRLKANPPRFLLYLKECFAGCPDMPQRIQNIQEFVGGCLMGISTKYQKALLLVGKGSNGKSVLMTVISQMFPKNKVVCVPPHSLHLGPNIALMDGAALNLVTEVSDTTVGASESLKAIIDGSPLTGSPKYQKPYAFCPQAGVILAGNKFFKVKDFSHGFWRRWIVSDWPNRFSGEKADPELPDKLMAEIVDITSWFCYGGLRLWAQGCYTQVPTFEDNLRAWKYECDPLMLFVSEEIVMGSTGYTDILDLYGVYRSWSMKAGHGGVSRPDFQARLQEMDIPSVMKEGRLFLKARAKTTQEKEIVLDERFIRGQTGAEDIETQATTRDGSTPDWAYADVHQRMAKRSETTEQSGQTETEQESA